MAAVLGYAGTALAYPGRRSFAAASQTFDLAVTDMRITVDGQSSAALAIAGSVPGPVLRWREGEEVVVRVTNRLDEPTSIHWHGLLVAGVMDGAPGFNGYVGIAPGETYTYRFALRQAGTYWYHSHSAGQEQLGMYGAIVIEPAAGERIRVDRDYVVVLSDHSSEHPDTILRKLKADPEAYVTRPRSFMDFLRDIRRDGLADTAKDRMAWGDMRMSPTDLADVTGYQFLMNGRGAEDNWTGLFKPGERVRLRFINASSMTFFDVAIPGLRMTVIAADGQDVIPVPVDEFRFGVGETYDVLVNPREAKAFTVMAEPIDRSGYVRGTLAPGEGMQAEIPPQRPRTLLSMADMGAMPGMDHGGMAGMAGMDHSKMGGMAGMAGMDHSKMAMAAPTAGAPPSRPVGWDAASTPPGKKALDCRDLKSLAARVAVAPTQEIIVELNGQMNRYNWTLNGKRFDQNQPIRVKFGERVRIKYVNTTMMAHPMHLHGMFVEMENGETTRRPLKHVVIVKPGEERAVVLTADEPGEWPFHCHLLYHMNAGMMTRFIVEPRRKEGLG
ncbi:MAG: copper oxidase [Rhodospirillales bacterium 69-11]|nr:MAG: copper oxidase [Rhodospirillales bacterium 69-11]